jgi:CheY-like chemotaxis protein
MENCTHIIIDNNGLFLYNQLIRNGYKVKDFIYENKPDSLLHLEYMLGKFIRETSMHQSFCFHLSLRIFPNDISRQKNCPPLLRGIDVYYTLQRMIKSNNHSLRFSFVFYSFLSIAQIKDIYPVICPDLEQNNFVQLPVDINNFKHFSEYKGMPEEAIHLIRGSYLSNNKMETILSGKTILIIDDDFEKIETAYQQLFNCSIIGLKQEKNKYTDLESTADAIIRMVNSEKIDLIISDLYLSETHKEFESNISNAQNISGVRLHKQFLSKSDKLKHIPLIFLTSSTRIWNYLQLQSIPSFNAWVPKPLIDNIHNNKELLLAHYDNLYFSIKNALNN